LRSKQSNEIFTEPWLVIELFVVLFLLERKEEDEESKRETFRPLSTADTGSREGTKERWVEAPVEQRKNQSSLTSFSS
jgi:hypothetical protein